MFNKYPQNMRRNTKQNVLPRRVEVNGCAGHEIMSESSISCVVENVNCYFGNETVESQSVHEARR